MAINPRLGVVVCKHVLHGERSVNYVERFPDGQLSISCGELDHSTDPSAENEYFWIHIGHILENDPSVQIASSLKPGDALARKSLDHHWTKA